jgi:cold-inducible RNA-binding protein
MDTKLYVGNLSYNTTEDDLRTLFSNSGTVTSVALIKDRRTGQSKGFAFVEMSSQNEMEQAIKDLDGNTVDNRKIKVNKARPPEDKKRSGSDNYNPNRREGGNRGKDPRKGSGSRRY